MSGKLSYNGVEWVPRKHLGHVTKAHIELAQRLVKYLGSEFNDWADLVLDLHKQGLLSDRGQCPYFIWTEDGFVKKLPWNMVDALLELEDRQWQTVVYFCIGASVDGRFLVKIGMTNDLERRLKEWQTFSAGGIFAGHVRGVPLIDAHCHRFAERRGFRAPDTALATGTEWFLAPVGSANLEQTARQVRALGKAYAAEVGGVWDPSNHLLSKVAA